MENPGFSVIASNYQPMRKKALFFTAILFIALSGISWFMLSGHWQKTKALYLPKKNISPTPLSEEREQKIRSKAIAAKAFAAQKKLNPDIGFLIDMSQSSGESRFYVYHFKKDSVINSGLVTHGRCNETWLEGRRYSNTPGSGCTSLGRYKIGYAYQGRFGLAYKLHGLDKTNDKAFERFVVLHSHDCVPESAVSDEICQSDGCPTVSPGFLQYLKPIIDKSSAAILLWVFE